MTEPRPGRWTSAPPNRRKLYRYVWTLWNLLVAVFVLGGRFIPFIRSDRFAPVGAAATLLLLLALSGIAVREWFALRRDARDVALADRAPDGDEFPSEIIVTAGGKIVGMDRGTVWFEGALLGFNGRHTSFLMDATDLVAPQGKMLTDWDRPFMPLRLRSDRKAEVQVRPLFGFGRAYRRRMRGFLRANQPSEADRQWPPISPYDPKIDKPALKDEKGMEAIFNERLPSSHVES